MASDQENLQSSLVTNNLISEFDKTYLPSNLRVLQRLLYETQKKGSQVLVGIKTVMNEIISIWDESSIDIKRIDKCREKLKKLHECFTGIKKFKDRNTKKVIDFFAAINDTFDVSQDDTLKMLGSMGESDKKKFLLQPVECIKTKLSVIRPERVSGKTIIKIYNNLIISLFGFYKITFYFR